MWHENFKPAKIQILPQIIASDNNVSDSYLLLYLTIISGNNAFPHISIGTDTIIIGNIIGNFTFCKKNFKSFQIPATFP